MAGEAAAGGGADAAERGVPRDRDALPRQVGGAAEFGRRLLAMLAEAACWPALVAAVSGADGAAPADAVYRRPPPVDWLSPAAYEAEAAAEELGELGRVRGPDNERLALALCEEWLRARAAAAAEMPRGVAARGEDVELALAYRAEVVGVLEENARRAARLAAFLRV